MSRGDDVAGLVSVLTDLRYTGPPPPPLGQKAAFDWVADCLSWLCQKAAPGLAVPRRDYSSETARVAFLSALGSSFHASTQIRLNLRRLYRAGGSAARELQRLAASLRAASQAVEAAPPPPKGPPDTAVLRQQMEQALTTARQQAAQLEQRVAVAGQEVQVLEGRVEKRHVELDRLERRLDSLQAIKPAHSGEVEALEAELGKLYDRYLHKFRNLEYLEGVLEKYSAARQEEAEEADRQLRRIQRQVAAEELRLLQGSSDMLGLGGGAAGAAAPGLGHLDSEDSEEEVRAAAAGGWSRAKALPRLALGGLGGGAGSPGSGAVSAAAAAAALDLLPGEDHSPGRGPATGGSARSRPNFLASLDGRLDGSGGGGAAAGVGTLSEGARAVSFGQASIITPGAVAANNSRRTTGSGNALSARKAGGVSSLTSGGAGPNGGADVLTLDGSSAGAAAAAGRSSQQHVVGDDNF